MKKDNNMKREIQEVREQLYRCIEKNGITDEPSLIDINNKLDELIIGWLKRNK